MKLLKQVLVSGAVAAALVTSAQASLINVEGILWDPEQTQTTNQPEDFAATSNFSQWYQNGVAFAPAGGVAAFTTPGQLLNKYVTGAGKFNTVNGVNQVGSDPNPETVPAIFAPGRELTYIYGGIQIIGVGGTVSNPIFTFNLANAFFSVYSDISRDYAEAGGLLQQINAANSDFVMPFLQGTFDSFNLNATVGTLDTLFGFADGLISVQSGAAFSNFNTNQRISPNGLIHADLSFTGSSQILVGSNISTVGTGEFLGNTIPEPTTVALLGLALLGLGATSSRRRTRH